MRITLSSRLGFGALGAAATATLIAGGITPPSVRAVVAPTRATPSAADLRAPATVQLPRVERTVSNRAAWSPHTAARRTAKIAVVRAARVDDVPPDAFAAYQRAASVITSAQPRCRLPWSLLAALGEVSSDHGRTGRDGVIRGPALNGRDHTREVPDTDGGAIDGDTRWDRAVGPMHLLPTTWSVVAVDANGDGKRDPQDLDDAALGTAVLLCGGGADLGTTAGRRTELARQTGSASYADLLGALSAAYARSLADAAAADAFASTDLSGATSAEPSDGPSRSPSSKPTKKPTSTPTSGPTSAPSGPPDGAVTYCTAAGFTDDPARTDDDYDQCVAAWTPSMGTSPTPSPPASSAAP